MTYSEQLRDPRWKEKRQHIINKADNKCESCDSETEKLEVHHGYYSKGKMAWEYPDETLYCLCSTCHWDMQERMEQAHYEVAKRNLNLDMVIVSLRRNIPIRIEDGFGIDNSYTAKERTSKFLHG
jgi:hypothetical protein